MNGVPTPRTIGGDAVFVAVILPAVIGGLTVLPRLAHNSDASAVVPVPVPDVGIKFIGNAVVTRPGPPVTLDDPNAVLLTS